MTDYARHEHHAFLDAAALTPSFRASPGLGRVGIILSGGNVDLDRLPWMAGNPAVG